MTLNRKENQSKIPSRMCVACREIKTRDGMFRFVRDKGQGKILENSNGLRSGKGLYICRDRECWDRLWSRRNLKRTIASRIDVHSIEWVEASLGSKG